jgi:predicted small lipoprotein YifL
MVFKFPMKHLILPALMIAYFLSLAGCGDEGPFGNTPPQGRPDWMKKKEGAG